MSEKTDALRRETEIRWDSHAREHEMTKEAVAKAEGSMDKRLEGMNEFRATLTNQAATFWTRDAQAQHEAAKGAVTDALDKRLDGLERGAAIEEAERQSARDTLTKRMWIIGISVGAITFIIGLLAQLATRT